MVIFTKLLLGILCVILLVLAVVTVVAFLKGKDVAIWGVILRLLIYTIIFIPSFNYVTGMNTDKKAMVVDDNDQGVTNDKSMKDSPIKDEETEANLIDKQVIGKKYNPNTGKWVDVYAESSLEKITANGGLGDSLEILKKQYGDYEIEGERIFFQDRSIYTDAPYSFSNNNSISEADLLWNITVNFEATDNTSRTEKEVLELAKSLIPQDAVEIDQSDVVLNDEYTTTIINYKSDYLAKRLIIQNFYGDAEIGSFAIHLNKYTGNDFEKGYFQLGITTGNPQP